MSEFEICFNDTKDEDGDQSLECTISRSGFNAFAERIGGRTICEVMFYHIRDYLKKEFNVDILED